MERAKEGRSKDKVIEQTEVSDEALDKVTGGVTLPLKRKEPKSPQPRVYTA